MRGNLEKSQRKKMEKEQTNKKNRKKKRKNKGKNCNVLDGKKKKKEEKQKQTRNKKEKRRKKGTVSKLLVQILLSLCQLIFGFVKKEFKLIIMVKALVLMTRAFLEG